MAKSGKFIRLSEVTKDQLNDLVEWRGQNQTEIFTQAIHMLWEQTNKIRNPLRCEHCGTAFNYYPHLDAYVQPCDCD